MNADPILLTRLRALRRWSLIIGVAASLLCVIGVFVDPDCFFPAYLIAFLFWLGITLGSLAIAMIHSLTGGAWGVVVRRVLESAIATLPLMALLFVPLLFGLTRLYPWATPAGAAELHDKTKYLNVDFFAARAAIYFGLWTLLAVGLNRYSQFKSGAAGEQRPEKLRLAQISGPGLVLYGFSITFAAVDWGMSLEPHWYSTMYGVLFMGGQAVSGLSFAILVTVKLSDCRPWTRLVSTERWHDLGNLLLAFLMFWVYVAYMQFLIIWSANLPEEIVWYQRRSTGGWQYVVAVLMALHFAAPFLALLSRDIKQHPRRLMFVAVWLVAMRYVDLFWLVAPVFKPDGMTVSWLNIVTTLAIGGWWLAMFSWRLARRAALPDFAIDKESHAGEPLARIIHGT